MPANRPPPSGRITIVFTDIEDSSRMTHALGDAVYHKTMREPHCQRIRAAIADHKGDEIKTVGDSFMIAFAHAADALACAAAIQESLGQPPITATDKTGKEWKVKVRIGVHMAERELIPHEEFGRYDYTGSDVNFAARVESLGAGGQIIVSDSTYRAAGTREQYDWKDWPDRRIKSFDQPETVWELLWDSQSRGDPGTRWLPSWFMGERNRYIPRPALEHAILHTFGRRQPDGSLPRLVTLHAEGGMGKTRLALACATQTAGNFPDGIYFIRLDDRPKTKEALAEAIGAAMGRIGEASLPDRLLADLRDQDMLLVLDNYESVDCKDVRDYIGKLLTDTRGLRLLVTGREAVKLSDVEQLIYLDEGMTEEEAEQLFVARAQLKKHAWQPAAQDRAVVGRIVQLCGRIPLAVEFAAAWIDRRTLFEIAKGIDQTPLGDFLGEQPRSGRTSETDRHQSLTRCLDWSFNLLEDWAQEGFARLGVFADTFIADTVAAVCELPDAQAVLDRLQDAALVRRGEVGGRSRYALHRFTRAYAAGKLASLPDAVSTQQRYVAHFRRLAEENGGPTHTLTLARLAVLDAEWRNVAAAALVAEKLGNLEAVQFLAYSLGDFHLLRGMWSEWERLDLLAVAAARTSGQREKEGAALNNLGVVYQAQGRWAEAEAAYQQSLAISREFGDRVGEGQSLNNLGIVYEVQGRWAEAEAGYQQSLTIRRKFGDRVGEGQTLNNLGGVYGLQGRWAEAEEAYQQSLTIMREFGDRVGEGITLNNLGNVYQARGRWAEAETAYHQSVAIRREFGDRLREGHTLNNLGEVYQAQGRWAEAEGAYQQSLAIERKFGDRVCEGQTLGNLARLREAQGNVAAALEFARQALCALGATEDQTEKKKVQGLVAKWRGDV